MPASGCGCTQVRIVQPLPAIVSVHARVRLKAIVLQSVISLTSILSFLDLCKHIFGRSGARHDAPKQEIQNGTFKLLLFISHRSLWSGAVEAGIID